MSIKRVSGEIVVMIVPCVSFQHWTMPQVVPEHLVQAKRGWRGGEIHRGLVIRKD